MSLRKHLILWSFMVDFSLDHRWDNRRLFLLNYLRWWLRWLLFFLGKRRSYRRRPIVRYFRFEHLAGIVAVLEDWMYAQFIFWPLTIAIGM